jgi:ankyrin repeat protein
VTDQENPQDSSDGVPSTNRNPSKKKSKVSLIGACLALGFAGFLVWPMIVSQFSSSCGCRAPDSDTKANLHNVYLACKAYWADSGSENICDMDIATRTTYGYIQSAKVKVAIFGDESDFLGLAYSERSEKVFKIDAQGAIEKLKGISKTHSSLNFLSVVSQPEGYLKKYFKACQAYWEATQSVQGCTESNAFLHGFVPFEGFKILSKGGASSFEASINFEKDNPYPIKLESIVLLANGEVKSSVDDYSKAALYSLNRACNAYWKKTHQKNSCTLERAAEFGFVAYPDLDLIAGGPEYLFTSFAKHEDSGKVFQVDDGQINQAYFLQLYDSRSGRQLRQFPAVADADGLAFSQVGNKIVEMNNNTFRLRNTISGRYLKTQTPKDLKGFYTPEIHLTYDDRGVAIAHGEKGKLLAKIPGLTSEEVRKITISPDHKIVAVISTRWSKGPFNKSSALKATLKYKRKNLIQSADQEIQTAVSRGKIATVEFLLANGADVNDRSKSGRTLLHFLSRSIHPSQAVAKLLISHGADVDAKNKYGETPLHYAVQQSSEDLTVLLIHAGADVKARGGRYEGTPLHYLRHNPSVAIVRHLLAAGADVNTINKWGATPLHKAASVNNSFTVVEFLITHGAKVNTRAPNGSTPLHSWARSSGSPRLGKLLIENGANINTRDKRGNTPLHYLCKHSWSKDSADLLIAKGADVNARSSTGITPLHIAVKHFNPHFDKNSIETLIDSGADVNARDNSGKPPLFYVFSYDSYKKKAEFLINADAEVNVRDNSGKTLLHYLAKRAEGVWFGELLVDEGANINARDNLGNTPLHYLSNHKKSYYYTKRLAKFLIDNGADVSLKNEAGLSPIDLARNAGKKEILNLLLMSDAESKKSFWQ